MFGLEDELRDDIIQLKEQNELLVLENTVQKNIIKKQAEIIEIYKNREETKIGKFIKTLFRR